MVLQIGYVYSNNPETYNSNRGYYNLGDDEWNETSSSSAAEQELIVLRESTQKALYKSWKEVETLHQQSSTNLDLISDLNTELQDAKLELAQTKIQLEQVSSQVEFYHSVPDILEQRIQEKKKKKMMMRRRQAHLNQSMSFVSNLSLGLTSPSSSSSPFTSPSKRIPYSQSCTQLLSLLTKTSSSSSQIGNNGCSGEGSSSSAMDSHSSGLTPSSYNNDTTMHSCPTNLVLCTHDEQVATTQYDNDINPANEGENIYNGNKHTNNDDEHDEHDDDNDDNKPLEQELALKLSSRDAVIDTLEKVAQDNVNQMVAMEEEMKRMRDLLQAHQIEY